MKYIGYRFMWGGLFIIIGAIFYNQPSFVIVGFLFLIVSFFLLRVNIIKVTKFDNKINPQPNVIQKSPERNPSQALNNNSVSETKKVASNSTQTDSNDFFRDYPTTTPSDFFADYPKKDK